MSNELLKYKKLRNMAEHIAVQSGYPKELWENFTKEAVKMMDDLKCK